MGLKDIGGAFFVIVVWALCIALVYFLLSGLSV
jgi:hypothetical protein